MTTASAVIPRLTLSVLLCVALLAWRTARALVVVLALIPLLGFIAAFAVVALLLLLDARWLLRLAAAAAAVSVWHWPVMLALLFAMPRLFLMAPGAVTQWLALKRHPRPRWPDAGPIDWTLRGSRALR